MKHLFVLFILLFGFSNQSWAQLRPNASALEKEKAPNQSNTPLQNVDGTNSEFNSNAAAEVKTDASHYKFISIKNDTTLVDTTLTIQKEYKMNYLKRDYFELLPFSNTGQVYNQLGYDFAADNKSFSRFGAQAKQIDFAAVEDVKYYEVATPLTELRFKSTMEQGQLAEGFFAVNTNRRFNVAVAFKGLRSLGKYRHIRSNGSDFKTSINYRTKNDRYALKAHAVIQGIRNQENGGIKDNLIVEFENGNDEFSDRSRFEVNFEDADNEFIGKRFFVDHHYNLIRVKDSVGRFNVKIGHVSNFEYKKFIFNQTTANAFFGDAFTSVIRDETRLEQFVNKGYVSLWNKTLGTLSVFGNYTDYNYGYNTLVIIGGQTIPNRLKGGFAGYGASYLKQFKKFRLDAEGQMNLSEENKGYSLVAKAGYYDHKMFTLEGKLVLKSSLPDWNYRLYQSDYKNYNWSNLNWSNVNTQALEVVVDAKKYGALQATYTTIDNYTYFGVQSSTNTVKPIQHGSTINYLKLRLNKEFKLGKFALDNSVLYQKVTQDSPVLNVPEYVIRNTFYYTNTFFNKNLFLQPGISFNYFPKYKMNAYDALLGEFYTQTAKEYGGYPRIDVFVNAKVRNARIYFKAEHLNSSFTGNNFYSAPNYPYRDWMIRFGLVWNFFL